MGRFWNSNCSVIFFDVLPMEYGSGRHSKNSGQHLQIVSGYVFVLLHIRRTALSNIPELVEMEYRERGRNIFPDHCTSLIPVFLHHSLAKEKDFQILDYVFEFSKPLNFLFSSDMVHVAPGGFYALVSAEST